MLSVENRPLVGSEGITERIVEMFNSGDASRAEELFTSDYIEHAVVPPGLPSGPEGIRQLVGIVRSAFPDFSYTIEEEIAEGDMRVSRLTARGTHLGNLMTGAGPVPPTGKRVEWSEMHMGSFKDGKLVEHWAVIDNLGLMQQLGLVPAPGQ
jgi:predicted ester cyclase